MDIKTYDKLARPPADALKRISGGRLSGKTDINPQWRYRAMTEVFGLCGIGWKYTIDRQWLEEGSAGEYMAFVNISLYVKSGDTWSEAIPGTGGSMLVAKEKNGLYNSDEAYKMATTDALSVAMKMIGVAADIYAGRWDGSKYTDNPRTESLEDLVDTLEEYIASGKLDDVATATIRDTLKSGKYDETKLRSYIARCKQIVGRSEKTRDVGDKGIYNMGKNKTAGFKYK